MRAGIEALVARAEDTAKLRYLAGVVLTHLIVELFFDLADSD